MPAVDFTPVPLLDAVNEAGAPVAQGDSDALRREALLRVERAHLRRVEAADTEASHLCVARRCTERNHHRAGVVAAHRAHPDLRVLLVRRLRPRVHLSLRRLRHFVSRCLLLLRTRRHHRQLNLRASRLHLARRRCCIAHNCLPPERRDERGCSSAPFRRHRARRLLPRALVALVRRLQQQRGCRVTSYAAQWIRHGDLVHHPRLGGRCLRGKTGAGVRA
eukprot:scaffold5392_cov70-Phaeocystis_antarctica.AAC.3